MLFSRRARGLSALLVAAVVPVVRAEVVTWNGGGMTPAWNDFHLAGLNVEYGNWGNTTSLPGAGSDVVFGSNFNSGNPNLNGFRTVHSVTIATATSFSFAGSSGDTFIFPTLTRTIGSAGTQTFSTLVDLNGNSTWSIDGSGSVVMGNSVSEAVAGSSLTKSGAGQVTLGSGPGDGAANSWTGVTTLSAGTILLNKAIGVDAIGGGAVVINGGTLRLNNDTQIDDSVPVTLNAGTLDMNSRTDIIGGLGGAAGTIALGAAGNLIVQQSGVSTAGCNFTGAGVFNKTGTGTLSLKSTGTLGELVGQGGQLNLNAVNYTLSSGTFLYASNGGTINVLDFSTLTAAPGASTVLAEFGGALNISGSHTTMTVPYQILAGDSGSGTIAVDQASVTSGTYFGAGLSSGSNGTITLRNGAHVTAAVPFAGGQVGSIGTFLVTGPGTVLTSTNYLGIGGSDPSDTGGAGTLIISTSASASTPNLVFFSTAASLVIDQGTLSAGQVSEFLVGNIRISDGASPALTVGSDNTDFTIFATITNDTSRPGSLVKTGTGTLTLVSANSFTGPVTINQGTVAVASVANSGIASPLGAGSTINLGSFTSTTTLLFTGTDTESSNRAVVFNGIGAIDVQSGALTLGVFSGGGLFTKTGAGTLTFAGGALNGTTSLSAGQLVVAGAFSTSQFQMSAGTSATFAGTTTIPSVTIPASAVITVVAPLTIAVLDSAGAGTIAISDAGGAPALTLGTTSGAGGNSSFSFGGSIVNVPGATGSLTKNGTGTLTLVGSNSYSGATTVRAGTLVINNSLTSPGGAISIAAGATLQASGFLQRQVTGAGSLTATGNLFVGDSTSNGYNFAGTLAVGSNIVQLLASGQALLGASTTLSAGGELIADGASGMSIAAGQTLTASGSATIIGQVQNNGLINGPATGQLSFNDPVTGLGLFTGNLSFARTFDLGGASSNVAALALTLASTAIMTQSAATSKVTATTISNAGQIHQSNGTAAAGSITGSGAIALSGGSLSTGSVQQSLLSITGGVFTIQPKVGTPTNTLGELAISGSGKLDLANNTLLINYVGATPVSQIRAYLAAGFNSGSWDGAAGIDSSTAHADATFQTALGYIDNGSNVTVKYTYYGDDNLDGVVNAADFQMLLDGLVATNANSWTQGDYTYDGHVDLGNDFNLFLANYLNQGSSLGDLGPIIADDSSLSAVQKSQFLSLVPEPATGGLLIAAVCAFATSRRSRR